MNRDVAFTPDVFGAFARLVDQQRRSGFAQALLDALGAVAGADHCVAYAFDHQRAELVSAASEGGASLALDHAKRYVAEGFWRRDPFVVDAIEREPTCGARLFHIRPAQIPDPLLRRDFYVRPRMREKVLMAGRRGRRLIGISVFRSESRGSFDAEGLDRLASCADLLLSAVAQHAEVGANAPPALDDVAALEARLRAWPERLTPREAGVLARWLAGVTLEGAALDLGIGRESAVTYRKRAFRRLGIATRHELLQRILARG